LFGAKLVPDFSQLEKDLENGDFQTEVDVSGSGSGAGAAGGAAAGGGGKGKGGGLAALGGIAKTLTGILGAVAILSQLEIVTEFIGLIARIVEIMLLPTLIAIMALLQPFVQLFLRLMPKYLDALKKIWGFVESLINAFLTGIGDLAGYLSGMAGNIDDMLTSIVELPGNIADYIADVIPGAGDAMNAAGDAVGGAVSAGKEFITSPFGWGSSGGDSGGSGGDVTVESMTVNGGPDTGPDVASDLSDESKKEKTGRNAQYNLIDKLSG